MNVNAINGEGLQAGDLQLPISHRLLHEVVLPVGEVGRAAVARGLERRDRAAVGVRLGAAGPSRVRHSEQISATPIWWSGGEGDKG